VAARADRVIFLADGNINDELQLGKYQNPDEDQKSCREKRLTDWLDKQGF